MTLVEIPQNKALDPMTKAAISVVARNLSTKARLGAVAQAFDPDAVDGDGDGMVQDGSPFERPALIKAVATASQRAASLLAKASRTQKSRSNEYRRRHSGMSAADIAKDAAPASIDEWAALTYQKMMVADPSLKPLSGAETPDEIKRIARQMEDYVEKDLIWMMSVDEADKFKELKRTDRQAAFRGVLEKAFDFSPKNVAKNRQLVEHVLTTNPEFRSIVDKYGMPPILSFGESMDTAHMAAGFYAEKLGMALSKYGRVKSRGRVSDFGRGIQKWFMDGIIENDVGSKKTKKWIVSNSAEALLVHEYGHYLADVVSKEMTFEDEAARTARWQAQRFAYASDWKEMFGIMGRPEWYEKYAINRREDVGGVRGLKIERKPDDVPDEIPHVTTAYAESSPQEAFAEAFSALFAHGGRDSDLVSTGMKELMNDMLELPAGKDPRESVMPPRASRAIVPDGFSSRGATMAINAERDSRLGGIDDPYELTAAVTGTLDGDDRVGQMVRKLQDLKDDPKRWDRLSPEWKEEIDVTLNLRTATTEEAALILRNVIEHPAFAEMLRRHGSANIYFSQTDLRLTGDKDVRGVLFGGFTPDGSESDQWWPPRVVIDMIGGDERGAPDRPMDKAADGVIAKFTGKAPLSVGRTHVSRSDMHVIRHEVGHSIHDQMWERVHRGEITGVRARLIEAYAKSDWSQFYAVLGRPDLWREHQRALANPWPPPSAEIGQVDAAYAWFNPKEMFAEAFTAYTSSNPEFRALLNDTMIEHMQTMLGDAEPRVTIERPPAMPGVDDEVPMPPPWDGFASSGGAPKSYSDFRSGRVAEGRGGFSRSAMFRNATTEQKVDLAVPTNERDYKLMLWDAYFEAAGFDNETIRKIDLSDPDNPKVPSDPDLADHLADQSAMLRAGLVQGADFDPATVDGNRQAVRATLDAFPRMREAANLFGMPPVTTMTRAGQERRARKYLVSRLASEAGLGERQIDSGTFDALDEILTTNFDIVDGLDAPRFDGVRAYLDEMEANGTIERLTDDISGGYAPLLRSITMSPEGVRSFAGGSRHDPLFVPARGDRHVGGSTYQDILLHEFAHHVDAQSRAADERMARAMGDPDAVARIAERRRLAGARADHIATTYGQSSDEEFFAESIAAVLSGSRDQEDMLSPDARSLARQIAGLPERDPVFAGRTGMMPRTADEMLTDRFGELWIRTRENMLKPVNAASAKRSRDGVPDVLETMAEAKMRTGLRPVSTIEFDHKGRRFTLRQDGDVFRVEIDGRTVAVANVVEGRDGLPEITDVDVSPGYEGAAPDKDLLDMVLDHARTAYPSARGPKRPRRTEIQQEGFSSIGPDHHDARQIDGTPGTPEYARSVAAELEAAKASGKKVLFDYNGETREVEVTEVYEKKGVWYMKGNDALRNGEERNFRLDRVSMPKVVKNPETGADEVAKMPGKPPRRPVPIFTGKAAEIFEGAGSWEEVAERLGKGRFVFFDFETTGIEQNEFKEMMHPGTPTQIGLVEIVDGKVTRRWSTHVNPGRPMWKDPQTGQVWSADNLKYRDPATGDLVPVTDEWLATQKPLKDALEEMLEWMGPLDDLVLGGQNHPYDDGVMKQAMADAGIDPARWNPGGFIDSQALAQSLLDPKSDDYPRDPEKGYKTVSLRPLAEFLGHDMGDGWHSADVDSEASWEAFSRLVRRAADHENSGKPVRRDLFAPGGGEKEFAERIAGYENQKRGWDYKVKKYKEAQASRPPETPADGFASRGPTGEPRVRARNPKSWDQMTQEERDKAAADSASAALDFLNKLAQDGYTADALRDMSPEELDAALMDFIAPGGEARVSGYVTGDGKPIIEVSNATMGKAFMAMGFHVEVISDDPNEQHILENSINDMQKALQNYVKAVAKDPDALLKDAVFRDWASKNGIDIAGLEGNPKKIEKAAKKFAEQFEINLCLYYKAGSNMLCGENIGIEREEMPQLGGRMKGDDTLAARAIKSGEMAAKELKIDDEKLGKLDPAKQEELKKLAKDPAKVAELAKAKDPLAKELFDVLNWNDTEANVESIADRAAEALGIAIDDPRFVDPATMLGAQNQLQGSKVENMADGAVKAVLEAIPVLEKRLGRKPTDDEIMDYLANEVKHGLFQPTLTAGHPGSQIYMLDGHHRWSGLLMANKKLEAMGLDVRVKLNIKNYQTDIRSGLELGRSIQVAMGVKDAKLAGEDAFKVDPNVPDLTPEEFEKAISGLLDKDNLINEIQKVRKGKKFRETEALDDAPGGQAGRIAPRKRPIQDVADEIAGRQITLEPESRVDGVKARATGYRAVDSGSMGGWNSVEDHIAIETERGNPLFDTHKEYVDKGFEAAWVTHEPGDAGRYVVSAGDIDAWEAGEVEVDPADIAEVDLAGATLVGTDDEGGFLYVRKKPTARSRRRIAALRAEEEVLDGFASTGVNRDGFASTGTMERPVMLPLDLVSGVGDTTKRGGKAQRDRDVVPDDFYTRRPTNIAGVRVPEFQRDEAGAPIPGAPIYRESMKIGRKTYTFEVDADGIVSVYTGRRYKMVAQMNLDRGHSQISGGPNPMRNPRKDRHHIDYIFVDKRHRRKGIATAMTEMAEHAYGGRVEHSASLTPEGKKFRDADMLRRGTPGAQNLLTWADPDGEGFASRGSTGDAFGEPNSPLDRAADLLRLGRGAGTDSDLPDATIGRFGTMVTPKDQQTLAQRLGLTWEQITEQWERNAGEINQLVDRFVADPEVREWTKYGLKLIGIAGSFAGATRGMAELIGKLEFNPGSGEQSGVQDVFDMITHFIEGGLGDALMLYGAHYANLIATEFAAMRLVTRQRAKKMIDDIRARMDGAGQKIGEISADMWARLRGAWAKTRPLAPVAAVGMKEWIIAGPGMTPAWARMSWDGYQSKSRVTQRLTPSDPGRWGEIAALVGPSPDMVDIASYRAGIGYGARRIKPLDVVRVYL